MYFKQGFPSAGGHQSGIEGEYAGHWNVELETCENETDTCPWYFSEELNQ